ncbi:VOC family protein [Leucobacter sp. CSA1]|uniref:VOC family protein n=1 Tax=Leucobacter chromiisoli TaxID=2796471 RepID=A0A934Q8J8_9MICO|nr:VOC family protein [Leucobacter chromiisoli]MBK0419275.1 VOC family protein [Leucobacter chromiisoli]
MNVSTAGQRIVPNIWCNRNAEEAGRFYASAFDAAAPGGASSETESRYPGAGEGLADFQLDFAGEPLTVAVTIADTRLVLINAGDEFAPNPSISFMLNFDPLFFGDDEQEARERLDALWDVLSEGGGVLMPLQEYPFSKRYGWVQDRFGVSWQLTLTDPEGDPRPFLMPSLLFGGSAQNRAAETVDRYLSVFEDAQLGIRVPYPEQTGPARPGDVMFSDFRIGDQWFTAMDSGVEQAFSFTCGMSLEVLCEDQEEIDRLWSALSAVPEAEQCGWLADPAGVSWQIVPANMAELMRRPNAYAMMEMKKLVIADF